MKWVDDDLLGSCTQHSKGLHSTDDHMGNLQVRCPDPDVVAAPAETAAAGDVVVVLASSGLVSNGRSFALRPPVHNATASAGLDWLDIGMNSLLTRCRNHFLTSAGKLLRLFGSVASADHKPRNNSDMRFVVVRRCSRRDNHWQRRKIHQFESVAAVVVALELEIV